jgi:homoserine dehydrogenase
MLKTIRLGIMGLGVVGSGLVELIKKNAGVIERKSDVKLEVVKALVKTQGKPRPLPSDQITYNPDELICDPNVDVVVEVIGGIEPARTYILKALEVGKSVVTANKAVLASYGDEIFEAATKNKCQVGFEASVCGGIPIIRALTSGLIANQVDHLIGILNGTTNYILTKMQEEGIDLQDALTQAQECGLAEADPTFDVQGLDAAHKLLILSELTFQTKAKLSEIIVEGITSISKEDILTAAQFGFVIKPIALGTRMQEKLDLRVHPALIENTHPLATVRHEFNAVMVKGDAIGEMIFYGKGAGSLPTASAVLSDIVDIARTTYSGGIWHPNRSVKLSPIESSSRFYFRFPIFDKPGIIGKLATVLGNHQISITDALARLECNETNKGNVMIVTHKASESVVTNALKEIETMNVLTDKPIAIRIVE